MTQAERRFPQIETRHSKDYRLRLSGAKEGPMIFALPFFMRGLSSMEVSLLRPDLKIESLRALRYRISKKPGDIPTFPYAKSEAGARNIHIDHILHKSTEEERTNLKNTVAFAGKLAEQGFFSEDLTYWNQLKELSDKHAKALPELMFRRLSLEAYLTALGSANKGNIEMLIAYKSIGEKVDPAWFSQHVDSIREFLVSVDVVVKEPGSRMEEPRAILTNNKPEPIEPNEANVKFAARFLDRLENIADEEGTTLSGDEETRTKYAMRLITHSMYIRDAGKLTDLDDKVIDAINAHAMRPLDSSGNPSTYIDAAEVRPRRVKVMGARSMRMDTRKKAFIETLLEFDLLSGNSSIGYDLDYLYRRDPDRRLPGDFIRYLLLEMYATGLVKNESKYLIASAIGKHYLELGQDIDNDQEHIRQHRRDIGITGSAEGVIFDRFRSQVVSSLQSGVLFLGEAVVESGVDQETHNNHNTTVDIWEEGY